MDISTCIMLLILISNANCDTIGKKQRNFSNYGPYKVENKLFIPCSGPKSVNLTKFSIEIIKTLNDTRGIINVTAFTPFVLDQLKITVYSMKENKNLLWTYKTSKPCQHYAFGIVFKQYLKSSPTCEVAKGTYTMAVNFEETTKLFLGTSFFYGDYLFKIVTLSKKGNLVCLIARTILSKLE